MSAQEIENEKQGKLDCLRSGESPMSEAEIDYEVMESFPASDPPSWTLGVARRKDLPRIYDGEKPSANTPSHQNEPTPSA